MGSNFNPEQQIEDMLRELLGNTTTSTFPPIFSTTKTSSTTLSTTEASTVTTVTDSYLPVSTTDHPSNWTGCYKASNEELFEVPPIWAYSILASLAVLSLLVLIMSVCTCRLKARTRRHQQLINDPEFIELPPIIRKVDMKDMATMTILRANLQQAADAGHFHDNDNIREIMRELERLDRQIYTHVLTKVLKPEYEVEL